MSQGPASLFTRLAPVLNVPDVPAERAFYERLGLPVIYEGPEYPDFIGFGTETVHFGIQKAPAANDPPSVLTGCRSRTPFGCRRFRRRRSPRCRVSPDTMWRSCLPIAS